MKQSLKRSGLYLGVTLKSGLGSSSQVLSNSHTCSATAKLTF